MRYDGELAGLWPWVVRATVSVTIGTVLGSCGLVRFPKCWFRRVLAVILAILGAAMLVRGIQS